MTEIAAEIRIRTHNLAGDLPVFTDQLGFRLDQITPADDPHEALISGHGLRLRLDQTMGGPSATLTLRGGEGVDFTTPGGIRIERCGPAQKLVQPVTEHAFVVRRLADQAPWIVGRAGMQYRDLIPNRLGGSIIASHIRIPDGGPVPDMVHYHTVGFQLIFCYRGWVDLVYEDQGPPFRLHAGNCVIQPPEIRHRVLYASDNIEVIEIGVPAKHMTTIDHEMTLPNNTLNPERVFQGQRFVHHQAEGAPWTASNLPGFVRRDTTIAANTEGVAGVDVLKRSEGAPAWTAHSGDILFSFVMEGGMRLEGAGQEPRLLEPGDAFVIPPGMATLYADPSDDLEILEVALPGAPDRQVVQAPSMSG